jgi:hypothetical protein
MMKASKQTRGGGGQSVVPVRAFCGVISERRSTTHSFPRPSSSDSACFRMPGLPCWGIQRRRLGSVKRVDEG